MVMVEKWAGKFWPKTISQMLLMIFGSRKNEDPNNLKTMKDVYTNGKEWTKLSKSDREEYEEILENDKGVREISWNARASKPSV